MDYCMRVLYFKLNIINSAEFVAVLAPICKVRKVQNVKNMGFLATLSLHLAVLTFVVYISQECFSNHRTQIQTLCLFAKKNVF